MTSRSADGEKLRIEGDRVLARGTGQQRLRCLLKTGGRGTLAESGDGLDSSLRLAPGQSHTLLALIPAVTLNGSKYDRFDAKKEWIVLPGTLQGPQEIVARY
jgi:hypothetical protein